jgi:hypothetical protein
MPIFESPDGGETVYVRDPDSTQRRLHSESPRAIDLRTQLMEDKLWGNIRRAAKTNPGLNDLLEQAKVLYHLSNR